MRHWRDIAWRAYTTRGRQDAFPLPWVLDLLTSEGLGGDCAYRIAASVLDVSPAYGDLTASFIHYSFYEFLVAQHAFTVLTQSYPVADSAVTDVLSHDLPPEMRRFLVGLLRQHATELHSWPAWLAAVYEAGAEEPVPYRRTMKTLAVYLACRLGVPADEPLRALLDEEHDPFLRNSLYWALARCDDQTSVVAYLPELETTAELASLNRGYLLHYYGDLPRTGSPPYPDDTPHVPWPNTRLGSPRSSATPRSTLGSPSHVRPSTSTRGATLPGPGANVSTRPRRRQRTPCWGAWPRPSSARRSPCSRRSSRLWPAGDGRRPVDLRRRRRGGRQDDADRCTRGRLTVQTANEFSDAGFGMALREAVKTAPHFISSSATGQSLVFLGDFYELYATKILPHLAAGTSVVTDRVYLSKYAYQQVVMATELGADAAQSLVAAVMAFLPRPALTIYLRCEPEVLTRRLLDRDGHCDEKRRAFIAEADRAASVRLNSEPHLPHVVLNSAVPLDKLVERAVLAIEELPA
jgi:thymidylate kinase